MKQALEEARCAYEAGEVPVGAVVTSRDRIIARAHNRTEALTDVTAHAEMQALTAAAHYLEGKYLVDCMLYVTLEPCVMCAGALYWSQIAGLVYGAPDPGRGYRAHHLKLHPKTQIASGVLAEESLSLLQGFFERKRKR